MIVCSDFLHESIYYGYSFELPQQVIKAYVVGSHFNCIIVDAIQMGTHNICLYKEIDKKYTGCYLKTMELLDCAGVGACAVIK